MRVIKFKLFLKGKFVGWEWDKLVIHTDSTVTKIRFIDSRYSEDDKSWNGMWILHDAKEQYTGYSDADGNELYENEDIIITSDGDGEQHESTIQWLDGGFCVDTGKLLNDHDLSPLGLIFHWATVKLANCENCGNCENPELLPADKTEGKL